VTTHPGYLHGYDSLGVYLGVSVKVARTLDARINFPKCPLPGVVRDVVLLSISEIDETIDRLRQEKSQFTDPATRPSGKDVRHLDVARFASAMMEGQA